MGRLKVRGLGLRRGRLARSLNFFVALVVIFSLLVFPIQSVSASIGIAWTPRTAAEANQWQSVVWSSERSLFVAVAASGTNRVMTSPDGVTWTPRTAAQAISWSSVTWSPQLGLFAAVSINGTNPLMTSLDGITWTTRTAEANNWQSITWSPQLGLFVAVSQTGTNQIMTSLDGVTWTPRTAVGATWKSITWSPQLGLFAAVANTGTNRVMTSPDGITWTPRTAAEANSWKNITWSPERSLFVAVSQTGTNRVMTSPDGVTWTPRTAAEANQWNSVTWSPQLGLFVAVTSTGTNRVMTSPDGVTWTPYPAAQANTWLSVTWSPERAIFVAVSQDGTNRVMTGTPRFYEVAITIVDNLTGEDGDTGTFKVSLLAQPSAPVTITLSSSNTNEGTVPASITIQPNDWDNPDANVVTVTGIDDAPAASDGAVQYTITTDEVTSSDTNFDALTGSDVVDVTMYNQNNDPPGINATIVDNTTGEDGSTAVVRFVLLSAPSGDVTIPLSLSNNLEASLGGVTSITITPANWNQPQNNQVTVTGLDDALADGDILYQLETGDPTSSDLTYDALTAGDVADPSLTNTDDELEDNDNDGVLNSIENAAPNGGDANNDGIIDGVQASVASFVSQVTGAYVVLEADAACQISAVNMAAESGLAVKDSGFDYPAGMMNFTADCGTPGYATTVTQYYYGLTNDNFVLRKHNPNTSAYFTVGGATLDQISIGGQTVTTVTYQATDGGELDTDAALNGIIVDPVGLAQSAVGAPNTGLGGRW